jgi:IS5 family transposase
VQVADNPDGLVLDLAAFEGTPLDGPLLAPAVQRIRALLGRTPEAVTADRGYGDAAVEKELGELGVSMVAIPRRGRPGLKRQKLESEESFRDLVKWRTGSEGRISYFKRSWGFERTLFDGMTGVKTWCGWGVLAHNAAKIARMTEDKNNDKLIPTTLARYSRTDPPPTSCRRRSKPSRPAA